MKPLSFTSEEEELNPLPTTSEDVNDSSLDNFETPIEIPDHDEMKDPPPR